ncbi:MAG: hypothetical protein R2838_02660 [Caldilineaceae bacterium]
MQAFLNSIQIASMSAMRKGLLGFGPANTTVVQFQTLMDSKSLAHAQYDVGLYGRLA